MSRAKLGVALVVLLLVAGGAAIALGIGPAPGGSSGEDIDDFPTETTADSTDSTDSDGSTNESATTSTPPFTFSIDEITECGQTCRDVTVTLFNQQNQTADNVTVYTRIYSGNSTAEEDRIWQGKEDIGTMDPGSSATRTQRISLSYADAYSVEQNDGWITVVTTVESDETTVTFEDQRNVM